MWFIVLCTLPWVLLPIAALLRASRSRSLDDFSAEACPDAPLVSVIVPARNEARNIARCVESLLATSYPRIEIVVVNDHSHDDTAAIVRRIATADTRLRLVDAPELPTGWFGKQWACACGAHEAGGALLLFTDADTHHSADLLPRAVNAQRARDADLLSVAGHQEMHSFWERVIQPHIFALLSMRYGGTEHVSETTRAENVIANGQFLLVRREAYDAMGGHALVRDRVAEDLAFAQEFVRAGWRIALFLAMRQLSTHMYASLGEIVAGWRKNIFAGGRHATFGGAVGRMVFPIVLLLTPLLGLLPAVALLLAAGGLLSNAWLIWSAICVAVALCYWTIVYRAAGQPLRYAALYPLGYLMLFYIAAGAVLRGRSVEWKDRRYIAS